MWKNFLTVLKLNYWKAVNVTKKIEYMEQIHVFCFFAENIFIKPSFIVPIIYNLLSVHFLFY